MEEVLEVRIDSAGYSDEPVIHDIFFKLEPSQALLVTGRSGSGKTTLLRAVTGLIYLRNGFFNGYVKLFGKKYARPDPVEILSKTSYIPQDPWYSVIGYSVRSEYCHTLSIKNIECNLDDLSSYGLEELIDHITYGLSSGQVQRLLWAEIMSSGDKLLFMDEPYTYIDYSSRAVFKKYVEKYLENGSIIVVDHIPSNWEDLDPTVLALDRGRPIYYGDYREFDEPELEIKRSERRSGDVLLRAENIWFQYPGYEWVLRGVDLEIRRGEVIGLIGVNGVGKTTLLKILAGIYKPIRGVIERFGSVIYVPENPLLYFTHPTPREELFSSNSDRDRVLEVVELFGLERVLDKPLAMLSSGERRRLAIASSILRGYDLYLLDEPTGGLDIYSVESVVEMIDYLSSLGFGVVIAHHDPRITGLFDRECLLDEGVLRCG